MPTLTGLFSNEYKTCIKNQIKIYRQVLYPPQRNFFFIFPLGCLPPPADAELATINLYKYFIFVSTAAK